MRDVVVVVVVMMMIVAGVMCWGSIGTRHHRLERGTIEMINARACNSLQTPTQSPPKPHHTHTHTNKLNQTAKFFSFAGPVFFALFGKTICYTSLGIAAQFTGAVPLAGRWVRVVCTVYCVLWLMMGLRRWSVGRGPYLPSSKCSHTHTPYNPQHTTQHTAHQVMLRCFFFFTTFGDALSTTSQAFLPGFLVSKNWLAVGKVGRYM